MKFLEYPDRELMMMDLAVASTWGWRRTHCSPSMSPMATPSTASSPQPLKSMLQRVDQVQFITLCWVVGLRMEG